METELARHVVIVAFRSAALLQELIPLLKEHCDEAEYRSFIEGIAKAIDSINVEVTEKVLSRHLELRSEIENKMSKYGQMI